MMASVCHIPPFSTLEAIRVQWFHSDVRIGAVALSLTFVVGIGMLSSSSLGFETQSACRECIWSACLLTTCTTVHHLV